MHLLQGGSRQGCTEEQRDRGRFSRTTQVNTGSTAIAGGTSRRTQTGFDMVNTPQGATPPVTTASPTTGECCKNQGQGFY